MKTIFSELYNRIMDFFQAEKGEQTSQCATNRLQVILMHDRTKLDPVTMGKMREELVEVFSKYVIIDKDELEIGLKSEGDSVALMLNIPIIRAKTDEELKESLKDSEEEEETVGIIEEDDDDEDDDDDDEIVEEPSKEDEPSEDEKIVESVTEEPQSQIENTQEPTTEEKTAEETKEETETTENTPEPTVESPKTEETKESK